MKVEVEVKGQKEEKNEMDMGECRLYAKRE